ncbi:unnamed protein product [Bursaphelenchus okinawaensis]|uniref:Cytochrome P450 n=1 Tax=Bursaphelenchus okinawaensis TaxID=465554 RepID=A0A811KLA4_9BILA|nr:unnamed protein product [Bursaphelenchus okinawaensis]CAG9105805.1 unnamed protein product [Bursaphelenchus okinawaensis]
MEDGFIKFHEKYGDVITFWSGDTPVIVLNTLELADEYMVRQGDVFVDRMEVPAMILLEDRNYGIINTSGDMWKTTRRFALKYFRDVGLGKSGMEEKILAEVSVVLDKLNKDIASGQEILMKTHTDVALGSVINLLICGQSFTADKNEAKFYEVQDCVYTANKMAENKMALLCFLMPFLLKVPVIGTAGMKVINKIKDLFKYIDEQTEEHLRTNDYTNELTEPRDFIDAFMLEKTRLEANGEQNHYFFDKQLRGTAIDLWFAGHDTTSATLNFTLGYLVLHQEIQKKVHDEIDANISSDRFVTMADRPNLPYLMAVLTESQRCANIIPLNPPRKTTEDINISGYDIKKGSIVFAQIAVIMQDEKHFKSPKTFNPDRFIDENGRFITHPAMLPFSLGKRACPGEALAKMEFFLLAANLLNQYRILPDKELPTLKKASATTIQPEEYYVRLEKRY